VALTGISVGTTLLMWLYHVIVKTDIPAADGRTSSVTLRKGATIRDSSSVLSVPCVLNLLVEERIPIKMALRTGRGMRSERCNRVEGLALNEGPSPRRIAVSGGGARLQQHTAERVHHGRRIYVANNPQVTVPSVRALFTRTRSATCFDRSRSLRWH